MVKHVNPPKLYMTAPHECPYLEGETASTVIIDPDYPLDDHLYNVLMRAGFRRSGDTIYRPHCRSCKACISVRIPVYDFAPTRSQKRCYQSNSDLTTDLIPATYKDEHFELYCRYQGSRHHGDVMDHNDPSLYDEYMVESNVETNLMEFRLDQQLVAVAVCDMTADGLSAVYTFFDPNLKKRGLGTFAIMKQIDYVRQLGLDYVYLGYWIKNCGKMDYKARFSPLFGFIDQQWHELSF